jgi:hypothetical protein
MEIIRTFPSPPRAELACEKDSDKKEDHQALTAERMMASLLSSKVNPEANSVTALLMSWN